ncbi:type VI secretion system Vgr family protein [Limoniibacter endophyticus]|uniref:Type VI secretion system secreted protein VgrG n=1 Tax=Limoniibacter endophyticus TaxID=1565040 RepID=A0A8J3DI84_9HYPH|nr:type VI secretion system tip protein TssI/VgrG [Limoniibacter endophyticus]GHC69472.1 hypothetical protein GCM10010136_15350 [Limoniibacter endophyticus]
MNQFLSAGNFVQANRILKIDSPLGSDMLLPQQIHIDEGVSTLFEIRAAVHAKVEKMEAEKLVGRLVDISLLVSKEEFGDDIRRSFNGFVTGLEEGPMLGRGLRSYSMTLRPQLWLLSQRSDCRIWMDKTSLDILDTLLSEHGLPAADKSGVVSPPPAQHYSVQWNETDLDYLMRRFEEDGLFFWFEHAKGSHKLVVANSASGWRGASACAQGKSRVPISRGSTAGSHIESWTRNFAFVPGSRSGADWNFETPSTMPLATVPSLVQMPEASKRELYEYPARVSDVGAAERAQKWRMQASEADHERIAGASSVRFLEPGRRFTPCEKAHSDQIYEEYVIVRIVHEISDGSYDAGGRNCSYANRFEAVPSRVALTPHRKTRRPRVHGAQVAIVAGPAGEEIETDSYGRIKLWFPWDRKARKDGSDTCWVRVAQNWAGAGFGGQIIPRIGMEVMCAFIDGDPDRPLVVGAVANAGNAVPYALPANKTKSAFRTHTHKGQGFNELSFEDENGREEIYLHAQKDQRLHIGNDRKKHVENDQSETVGRNKGTEVGKNHDENIGKIKTLKVGDRYEVTVGKSRLVMSADGTVHVSGTKISFEADQRIDLSAASINIRAKANLNMKAKGMNMLASLINMAKG